MQSQSASFCNVSLKKSKCISKHAIPDKISKYIIDFSLTYIAHTHERCNCFKVNGGPQIETNIWQVLIGSESKTEASIKQPQTEIKYNMLVAD